MSKRTPKVLTPEQMEEIRTKDFFDMILPGTVKFLSDHYIVGDSYRCVSGGTVVGGTVVGGTVVSPGRVV